MHCAIRLLWVLSENGARRRAGIGLILGPAYPLDQVEPTEKLLPRSPALNCHGLLNAR